MLVIAAIASVLLAVLYAQSKLRMDGGARLSSPHGEIMTLGVQIICGDCAGDDERPVKTCLDRLGNCAQCGGRSYVLASIWAHHRMIGLPPERRNTSHPGSLRPGGVSAGLHAVQIP